MKINSLLLFLSLALPLGAAHADLPATGASPKPGETQDAGFIQKAGQGGLAEVELSRMAIAQASSPDVKRFAQQMVDAHTQSNRELGLIAARQHQQMPAQMDDEHMKLRGRLEGTSGPEFDRIYLKAMIADHEKMATLLGSAKGTSSDNAVEKFARNTLPAVEQHLEMARSLQSQLR